MCLTLRASVDGAACARFLHDDCAESWQRGLESIPDPLGEHFTCWVLKPGDIVQVVVIELLVEGIERGLEICEIADPADGWIDVSADVNLDAEGMAVQAGATMSGWNIRQLVRCLETKLFEYFHLT